MTIEEWALVAAVASSGPWSGLLAMLTTILHPMMAAMDGRAFRNYMDAFLRFARKAWFNYVCSIGMGLAPIVALVALWGDWSSASFVLTAIGLGSVIVGVYTVANVWKEPLYDAILTWDPEAMPADWEAGRRRYYTVRRSRYPGLSASPGHTAGMIRSVVPESEIVHRIVARTDD